MKTFQHHNDSRVSRTGQTSLDMAAIARPVACCSIWNGAYHDGRLPNMSC